MRIIKFFIISIFLFNCSFDNKSGIWKDNSNPIKKKDSIFKDFETIETKNINIFNEVKKNNKDFEFILNKPLISKKWPDIFYNKANLYDNFNYDGKNEIIFKSKKISNHKINKKILYDNQLVISSDSQGNIILYSIKKNGVSYKYNFYKKKFKKLKKELNLILDDKILFVTDNLGYIYAYDYTNNKIIWAKRFKVPFRSNIKIVNNNIFTADQNNTLFVIDKLNGNLLSQIPSEDILLKNDFKNNLSLGKNNLFFLNTFGSLYSIGLNDLKVKWLININSALNIELYNLFSAKTVKLYKEKLIISTNDNLHVLNARTGSYDFKFPIVAKTDTIIFNDYIFLVSENNLLVSLNANTGKVIYSHSIEEEIAKYLKTKKKNKKYIKISSLYLINNELYVFLKNSYIIKFHINGSIINIKKLPKQIMSDPIFINNNLLYIDSSNKLIILN